MLLDGLRVVELSQLIAAPLCGLTLADWGAQVVKVEPAEGEYTRTVLPFFDDDPGRSAYYYMLNRGKRSVALDYRTDTARRVISRLVDSADVVVESLGEGGRRIGLDPVAARRRNPKLIWCCITGRGREHGGRMIDPSLQAAMGMMALSGEADGRPLRLPVPLVDFMTGMYATQAVLAALLQVRGGGDGAFLDCAMLDAAATLTSSAGVYGMSGNEPLRRIGTENMWYVPAGNFEAADGRWVQLMAINEHHWKVLATALGHPEWVGDPRFTGNDARVANRALVHGSIADAIRSGTADHWARTVTEAGGFCQAIVEIEDAWTDPTLRDRRLLATEDAAGPLPFPVPTASLTADLGRVPGPSQPAPALGEHSADVLIEAGFGAGDVAEMLATGELVGGRA